MPGVSTVTRRYAALMCQRAYLSLLHASRTCSWSTGSCHLDPDSHKHPLPGVVLAKPTQQAAPVPGASERQHQIAPAQEEQAQTG